MNQEVEFAYYQNCFTWTLRNGEWRKIPSNTLAEGDIIKLLHDDTAPAFIQTYDPSKAVDKNGQSGIHKSVTPPQVDTPLLSSGLEKLSKLTSPQLGSSSQKHASKEQSLFYFNKGSKINMKHDGPLHHQSTKNMSEPHEAFEKGKKEYILFIVKKTPCV